MLGKLYRVTRESGCADPGAERMLLRLLGQCGRYGLVEPIKTRGTSGLFFQAETSSGRKFLKTGLDEEGRPNLVKEAALLGALQRDGFEVVLFDLRSGSKTFSFLEMPYLEASAFAGDPFAVRRMIECDYHRIANVSATTINYSSDDLLSFAELAMEALVDCGKLVPELLPIVRRALERFAFYGQGTRQICHGDLGPENIVMYKGALLALDWEDALMAFPGYDMAYYLTFFINRKQYNPGLLERVGLDRQFGKDVMTVVTLLKAYLSHLQGVDGGYRLSVSDRIREFEEKL